MHVLGQVVGADEIVVFDVRDYLFHGTDQHLVQEQEILYAIGMGKYPLIVLPMVEVENIRITLISP